jgi:hypothetical protein
MATTPIKGMWMHQWLTGGPKLNLIFALIFQIDFKCQISKIQNVAF